MAKFKLRLNQNELKALGSSCMYAAREFKHVSEINELITVETCERLWNRVHNMYRPDVDKYTMRLSAVEAQTLMDFVFPVMQASEEIFFDLIAGAFSNELHHQLDREIHVLNARYNYGQ